MKTQTSSLDGFVPRRPRSVLGQPNTIASQDTRTLNQGAAQFKVPAATTAPQLSGAERQLAITQSLRQIEDSSQSKGPRKTFFRRKPRMDNRLSSHRKLKRIVKIIVLLVILGAIGLGGFLAYKAFNATGLIFQGGGLGLFQSAPLQQDSNGRSNFLVLGTTDDDPTHDGGNLTDSMMIISVDQTKHNVYFVSIPRDLYVAYGTSCASGTKGKINVYFSCVNDGSTNALEQARLSATQAFVGNIFGLNIQYGIHVNSKVLPQAVDAVGGIDVNIQGSNGAPGILDRNFDEGCNYKCYRVKYTNGVHHLDGSAASFLSMARGDTAPTYGLANSNFDREANQQKIIIALKAKAMTTGTLTDLTKVTKLIDALGNNLRTNIQTSEIRTLMQVMANTPQASIHTYVLNDPKAPIVTTGMAGDQSVVLPTAGEFNYSALQKYIGAIWSGDTVGLENASVSVYNGSKTAGVATTTATTLKQAGFTVTTVSDATTNYVPKYTLYDQTAGKKPATLAKLEKQLGVNVTVGTPTGLTSSADFVVVVGVGTSSTRSTSQ